MFWLPLTAVGRCTAEQRHYLVTVSALAQGVALVRRHSATQESHWVAVVLLVEEVGHSDDQLVVAVPVNVADGGVAQDVRVHKDEALLAGV